MRWVVVFGTNILVSALLSLRGNLFRCPALAKTSVVIVIQWKQFLDFAPRAVYATWLRNKKLSDV